MSDIDLSWLVGGKSCTVPCHIFNNGSKVSSLALADTGANALALIDTRSAHATSKFLSVPIERLPNPIVVRGFNGIDAPPIASFIRIHICVDRRRLFNVPFLITDLGGHNLILGRKWMSYLKISLDVRRRRIVWPETLPPTPWFAREITINMKDLFYSYRNPRHQRDSLRRDRNQLAGDIVTLDPLEIKVPVCKVPVCKVPISILPRPTGTVQPRTLDYLAKVDYSQLEKVTIPRRPRLGPGKNTEFLDRKDSLQKMNQELAGLTDRKKAVRGRKSPRASEYYPANLPKLDICAIGAVGFHRNMAAAGATVFSTSLYEIDQILEERTSQELQEDQDYQDQLDARLPAQYRDFRDVFSKEAANKLPPHR